MIPVSVDVHLFFVILYFIIFFDHPPIPHLRIYKMHPRCCLCHQFPWHFVLISISGGGWMKKLLPKMQNRFIFASFCLAGLERLVWELPFLCYHEIMLIYPYHFVVVINLLFSWIIFINDCICILTGSPG